MKRVFDPQTREIAGEDPRVLICDGFGSHVTLEILEFCLENNIILCRLPSHTSHKLQPCDVGAFGPLKAAYRDQVEVLYRRGVGTVRKEHFTSLYSPARKSALTSKNIKAAWAGSGLFPFNPDRVLRKTPKPISVSIPDVHETPSRSNAAGEVLAAPMTPITPVTPLTTNALSSLRASITEQTDALDETSKQDLQKNIQKLANAAQMFIAERDLLREQTRFLLKANNEAKDRRSTKSSIVGRAKVMSHEDIMEMQAKQAAKEQATTGKRGRKRKSEALDEGTSEQRAPVARMI
jgi:hypothetical protein